MDVERNKLIMIVEDEKAYTKVLVSRLNREGYETVLASTGEECLEKLKRVKPALILLDLIMPDKDGFDTLREISENSDYRGIRIIVLSNLSQEEDIHKARELGAEEFVVKSHIGLNELIGKINRMLNYEQRI